MRRIPIPTMAAGRQAQVVWSQWYYAHQAAPCLYGSAIGFHSTLAGSIFLLYNVLVREECEMWSKIGKEVSPSSPSGMRAHRSCWIAAGKMR